MKIHVAREVAPRIAAYYAKPGHGAGGLCHVVLDDGNLEDDHVRWSIAKCEQEGDEDGAALMRAFLEMSLTQRRKAIALVDGQDAGPAPAGRTE